MPMLNHKPRPGWLAIELRPDFMRLVHVVREQVERPRVALRKRVARVGDDTADLTRLRRSMGLQGYRCTTSAGDGAYQIVQTNTPLVGDTEMTAALRWSIKDALEFPVDDAIIVSLPVPTDGAPAGRPPTVLAVAARRERVAARVQHFQRSRVPLQVIDLAETAQRNLAALFETAERGLAFLSFTDKGGLLTFTRKGELYAMRHIDVGLALLVDGGPEAARNHQFERITLELQRSLDNFDRMYSRVALEKVLLAPHDGSEALLAYLQANLALPVERVDLGNVLDLADGPGFENAAEQAEWLHPIGLALRAEALT